jgi:hypothetical protein
MSETKPLYQVCTPDNPCPSKHGSGHWRHPSAKSVYDGEEYERYECPVCGIGFKVEISQ